MEKIIWQGRKSFRSQIFIQLIIIFIAYFNYQLASLVPPRVNTFINLIIFILILEVFRRVYDTKYTITDEHIIQEKGILSLLYQKNTVRIEDIREVKIYQTLLGRIFDFGTVIVGTAAESSEEIIFEGVFNPTSVAQTLKELSIEKINQFPSTD